MKKQASFTLLETLIALSLSCVVIFGMLQTYHNLIDYLKHVQAMLNTNRKVCLLFNQMERDFNTAFIPPLYKEVTTEEQKEEKAKEEKKEQQPKKELTKEEQEKEKEKEQEKLKDFFLAVANEQELSRFDGKNAYPFKSLTLINTNPLQVYGQRCIRIVRVLYELQLDKENTNKESPCYKLWRRETTDINNVKVKVDEFAGPTPASKANPIRTHLVADNIKELFIEYVYKKEPTLDTQEKKESKEPEEKIFFSWGDKKETWGIVPTRAEVTISFWNDEQTNSQTFKACFPVLSFPTQKQEDKKQQEQTEQQSEESGKAGKSKQEGKPADATSSTPTLASPTTAPTT